MIIIIIVITMIIIVIIIIIIATTTGIFLALKTTNVKPPKAMGIMKLAGKICGGVIGKDYAVYKK